MFLLQQRWMATTSHVPCFTWYDTERQNKFTHSCFGSAQQWFGNNTRTHTRKPFSTVCISSHFRYSGNNCFSLDTADTPAESNLPFIISPAPLMTATGAREPSGADCTPVVIRNLRAMQTFKRVARKGCHVCCRSEGGTSIPTAGSVLFHFHVCSRLLDKALCVLTGRSGTFSPPSTTNLPGDITTYKPVYSR